MWSNSSERVNLIIFKPLLEVLLSYKMFELGAMYLLTVGIEQKTWFVDSTPIEKIEIWASKMQTEFHHGPHVTLLSATSYLLKDTYYLYPKNKLLMKFVPIVCLFVLFVLHAKIHN